ncbi:MAG: hypothetical protein M3N51_00050, partial [Actinomycetota bacterium]|nr:hypothetical protein [Actinomycetota bacterium]
HPSRREFLRQFGVTALTGAVVMSAGSPPLAWALGPAKSWSDPSAWPGGKVPGPGDVAAVEGAIVLDREALVAGVVIGPGGSLSFSPQHSVLLESTGNVIVEGQLSMHPSSEAIHTLRFPDVNDSRFQGGGMDPLSSDVGLWVMGAGSLDLQGSPKQAWAYQSRGTGWQVADDLVAAPVSAGDFEGFRAVALGGAVPSSYRPAEVLNLTRNVRLEGSSGGQSHVLIRSTAQQRIENVQLRYMGVGGTLGRYPLHFHHCMDGSRGSVVRGVVVRDSQNHAFVPHNSHGITFQDCIAYDITEDAYWWDPRMRGFLDLSPSERRDPENQETPANDISWEGCVAALVRGESVGLGGFRLGRGTGNRCVGCVAVGVQGGKSSAGFVWPEGGSSVWTFEDDVAHNNRDNGIFVWQNTKDQHVVDGFVGYHNGRSGIEHGAYLNGYHYQNGTLYGNGRTGIILHALSREEPLLTFRNMTVEASPIGLLTKQHTLPAQAPVQVIDCDFSVPTPVRIEDAINPAVIDFVGSNLEPSDIELGKTIPGLTIRLQDGASAVSIDERGSVQSIGSFSDGGTPSTSTTVEPAEEPDVGIDIPMGGGEETTTTTTTSVDPVTRRRPRRSQRRRRRVRGSRARIRPRRVRRMRSRRGLL